MRCSCCVHGRVNVTVSRASRLSEHFPAQASRIWVLCKDPAANEPCSFNSCHVVCVAGLESSGFVRYPTSQIADMADLRDS